MRIFSKAGNAIIKLLNPESKSLAHAIEIAQTIAVQAHAAAPAAKAAADALVELHKQLNPPASA